MGRKLSLNTPHVSAKSELPGFTPPLDHFPYTYYTDYMQTVDTQNTRNVAVKVPEELYVLIKRAAHRREMTLAEFVRATLKEAAQFYVEQA